MLPFGQTTLAAGRVVDLETCVTLLAAMQTGYFIGLMLLAWRYGRPSAWPVPAVGAVVVSALAISFVWWWIDKAVEGDNLIAFSPRHSLTAGDLLAAPQLVTAGIVVLAALVGRIRRARARRARGSAAPA
jgi:hypothetical protein